LRSWIIRLLLCVSLLIAPSLAQAKGVVLNFSDVDIATMVKFISDLTGKNFIMDERVKGKISVYSPAKLTPEEAFNVFTSVLELKGFTVVSAGKVYKIIPTSAAKQSVMKILSAGDAGPVNESYVARVISLDYISSQEAVSFLQPLVSKDGFVSGFGPGNLLLLVDSNLNIEKVLGILALIDTDQIREGGELVYLNNAPAEPVARVVQEWLGGRSAKTAGQQSVAAPGNLVVADPRLNALLVFGNEKDKAAIKRLVATIDVPQPSSSSKVNVFFLEHTDALEVAKVLEGVVRGISAAGQPGAPPSAMDSRISITPDKSTNALVIMASPTDYQNLLQVIQKLDHRRRQVFVRAVIAEVSIDRLKELGVEWGVVAGGSSGDFTAAGLYDPQGAIAPLTAALSVLKNAGFTIPDLTGTAVNFSVILKALNSTGAVNVLSTPTILTSDNKEAEIFVGENVPFLGKVEVSTSSNPSLQSIDRKDTGIILRLTPQISEGEFVRMDLYQEISAVKKDQRFSGASDLITTKRSAKTSVVVKDQETVVIGGLIADREIEDIKKVPLLGDIPLLGWLFKSSSVRREKTNLLILLTPHIIKDARDLNRLTEQQQRDYEQEARKALPGAAEAVTIISPAPPVSPLTPPSTPPVTAPVPPLP
jgi:general secretion pathway protein D